MCMEDIRIMRKTSVRFRKVTVTNVSVQIIEQNELRVALWYYNGSGAAVAVDGTNPAIAAEGRQLTVGQAGEVMDLEHHGRIVTQPLFAITAAGSTVVTVWETILEEQ